MTRRNDDRPFARKLNNASLHYAQELLLENERLRLANAALESENEMLRERLESADRERASLLARMQRAEEESRRYAAEYLRVEQQTNDLTNLYVASYRLHSTMHRDEVLEAIREIVVNLIGSEEFAVFELGEDARLRLATSFGIDESRWSHAEDSSLPARVAATGEPFISDGGADVLAALPLLLGERVVGVVVIFRLLPHKPGLGDLDRELFDLLSAHAGTALYCSARLGGEVPA